MHDKPINKAHDPVVPDNIITATQAGTLWGLFRERVRRSAGAIAYRSYEREQRIWVDHSWAQINQRVETFRAALARENTRPGDCIAILLPNGPDWICLDLAAHGSGLVVVGLYLDDTAANNAYILGHCGARLALIDTEARWNSLLPLRSSFPALERVWLRERSISFTGAEARSIVRVLEDVLTDGPAAPAHYAGTPNDLATLIYTSGTTGRPKGVMLSHYALLWNAQATACATPPFEDDVFLSILPIAHAFERTLGYYLPMMGGSTVAFARSAKDLTEDLITIRPTAMLGVPLLFERMAMAIRTKAAHSMLKRAVLELTVSVGWHRFLARQQHRSPGLVTQLLWLFLGRNIAGPVLTALGGRLRVAVSGGAPLEQPVSRMLLGLGLPLVEGYGLTEAAPVVCANKLDDNLPGSVGRPLQGIEVKLSTQNELLVRTPSVMSGYWADSAHTRQALDPAGWLATGDIAELKEGRVFVRGRLSDVIALSIGEKVNPNIVEAKLISDPLFKQVLVVGEGRPFIAAVIVLNTDMWRIFAANKGLNPEQPNHPASRFELLARIAKCLADMPRYAQIYALHLTLEPWTIEAGLLTPTLKVKRDRVVLLFSSEIAELYAKH